jgi:signal transduction histidine kinase
MSTNTSGQVRAVADALARWAPSGLLQRVRWLFLLLTLLVAAVMLLDLPRPDVAGWPNKSAVAGAAAVWAGWAIYRYRRPDAPLVTDVVPLVVIVTMGVAIGSAEYVFGPVFVTLYYRSMFGTQRQALGTGIAYAGAYLLVVDRVGTTSTLFTVLSVLLAVLFVAVAIVMQSLSDAARRHEQASRWERVLTDLSTQLLKAETRGEIRRVAVDAAARMVQDHANVTLWARGPDDLFVATTTAGYAAAPEPPITLALLPESLRAELLRGEPQLLTADETHELALRSGHSDCFRQLLISPLVRDGELQAAVVIAGPTDLQPELLDVMRRFTNELVLALERSRLLHELERTATNLRRADEVKDQFLSTVSHELRTPLTVARGFVETLLARGEQLTSEQREDYLRIILRQATRQQRLIDDLLTTSRMLAGRLQVTPTAVDVPAMVAEVVTELRIGSDLLLRSAGAGQAWVDPLHLTQILGNLLANAIKYGRSPFEVRITSDATGVTTQVLDHGPGIPEDMRASLFEPFEQGGRSSTSSGVGLGLAIARRLAIANGGSLELCGADDTVSRPNAVPAGACFLLRLPAFVPHRSETPPVQAPDSVRPGDRIACRS